MAAARGRGERGSAGKGLKALSLVRFLASGVGRGIRILAGVALALIGVAAGGWWLLLTLLGLVFIVVGAANLCLLAPLFGGPVDGRRLAR